MSKILIVDDNESVNILLTDILSNAGHKVTPCASGSEALMKLGIQPEDASAELPDLLVTDIMMPGTDGYTISTAVRNNPRTRSIPILVISGLHGGSRPVIDEDSFLAKPFNPDELVEKVTLILNKRKPQS
jgi:CheY-like chemotaxis protein